jgi:uncharacterized protein HemX
MRKIILLIIVLAAGIALGIYFQKQTKAQKIENQVQTDADKAGAAMKEGVQKTESIATNVAADVKVGAQKVSEFTTNAVGEIKAKMP